MKNLVVVHLESLSNFIYNMNRECFPNLNYWSTFMDDYSNYYSSATSTQMVISDFFMGKMDVFESASYLECAYEVQHTEIPILLSLRNKGYATKYYDFGNGKDDEALVTKFHNSIDRDGQFFFGYSRQSFSHDVEDFIGRNSDNEFALFIKDVSSHIGSATDDFDKIQISATHWFKEKYRAIDKTVGMIFNLLKENKILENTLIVLYGDHGDEPYFHSFHKGYFHAIEPFCDIIHCPLFIFDGEKMAENHSEIVSTEDLKSIIEGRLIGKSVAINRKYAFSRNLFAAQRKMENVFNKAYGVTDSEYTLIITRKGLALYANCIDPLNLNNLLNFYKIKNKRLVYNKIFDNVTSGHFNNYMSDVQKKEIEEKFYELKAVLKEKMDAEVYLQEKFPFDRINCSLSKEELKSCRTTLKNKIYKIYVACRSKK